MLYNLAFRIFLFLHIILNSFHHACVHAKSLQSCLTLCNPMDSSDHGILQARILEWVAISSSWDLPYPWMEPVSPVVVGGSTQEAGSSFTFHL